MTAADRLEHERETPSLNAGWLLTLQQTQGFVAAATPYPRRRHEVFDTERWPLTVAEDHAKDSMEPLAASLRRNAPSQSLARALRRSTRLKSNRKSQRKHSAKEVDGRDRQKMPQWGLIADYRARIGRKRHYGARNDEVQGPNARTIMRLASDVFAKHQVREIC